MDEGGRESAGCLGLVAGLAAVVAGSLAMGFVFGAWAGLIAFAVCCIAFSALCLVAAGSDHSDE